SYREGEAERAGVLSGGQVTDAGAAFGRGPLSVRQLLAEDRLSELAEAGGEAKPLAEVELLTPVPDPEKIRCSGLNYRAHAAEAGIDPPESPALFGKYRNALVADGASVPLPQASSKVDFEAEVAVVIGRRCSSVSEAEALDAVAGYTLLNDL